MARLFDGIDDRIDLANEANFDFTSASVFSVFARAKVGSPPASREIIVSKDELNVDGGWWIAHSTIGTLEIAVHGSVNQLVVADNPAANLALTPSVWQSVGFTYDGSATVAGTKPYIDGVVKTGNNNTDAYSGTMTNNIPVQVGCSTSTATPVQFLAGSVAEVAIWTVVLTPTEVSFIASGGDPLTVRNANLLAFLPLCGDNLPEPDLQGTNVGTVTGATRAEHPTTYCAALGLRRSRLGVASVN